jgi:hypothetical protein
MLRAVAVAGGVTSMCCVYDGSEACLDAESSGCGGVTPTLPTLVNGRSPGSGQGWKSQQSAPRHLALYVHDEPLYVLVQGLRIGEEECTTQPGGLFAVCTIHGSRVGEDHGASSGCQRRQFNIPRLSSSRG